MKIIVLVAISILLQGCGLMAVARTATGQDQIDVEDRVEFCPDGQVAEYEEIKRAGRHYVWFKCVPDESPKRGKGRE